MNDGFSMGVGLVFMAALLSVLWLTAAAVSLVERRAARNARRAKALRIAVSASPIPLCVMPMPPEVFPLCVMPFPEGYHPTPSWLSDRPWSDLR